MKTQPGITEKARGASAMTMLFCLVSVSMINPGFAGPRSGEKYRFNVGAQVNTICSANMANSLRIGTLTDQNSLVVTGADIFDFSMFCNAPFEYSLIAQRSQLGEEEVLHTLLSHKVKEMPLMLRAQPDPADTDDGCDGHSVAAMMQDQKVTDVQVRPVFGPLRHKKTGSNTKTGQANEILEEGARSYRVQMSLPAVQGEKTMTCTSKQLMRGKCSSRKHVAGLLTRSTVRSNMFVSWEAPNNRGQQAERPQDTQDYLILRLSVKN